MATKKKPAEAEAQISMSIPTLVTALGLMVTIMLAIAGAVAGVYQSVFIPSARTDLELKLDDLKKQYQDEAKVWENKEKSLQAQVQELEKQRNNLMEAGGSPTLSFPKNDEVLISSEITFKWDYKSDQIPHFIIEITRVYRGNLSRATYSVLQPQNRIFHIPITSESDTGEYLWRVRPGLISEGNVLATGPWSAYQSFWVFTSVKQKIAHMRRLRVGMYPSFTDKFNLPVAGGKYEGLSVELAHFLADELSTRFPREEADGIKVEIVSYAWQDLLTELARNSVDVVISSVTATKNREQEFGILFSKGYYVTHQMLLSNQLTYDSNRSLFENLRKKRIGVLKGTTNERAANYVAEKCKCEMEISASFLELIESKNALFRRDVDLLLTDDIWLTGQSNMGTFSQYGSTLDDELRDFYTQEYGRSQEEYGIAVSKNGGDDLIPVINEILSTPKAKQFLDASEARARAKGQIASGSR